MRLLIVAFLAIVCASTSVATAQTAGPTAPRPSRAVLKAAPGKPTHARRVVTKRVVRRGKALHAKPVAKRPTARVHAAKPGAPRAGHRGQLPLTRSGNDRV